MILKISMRKVYLISEHFIIIVSIMMETIKRNRNTKMDWNALDRFWAEQYETDYGIFFIQHDLKQP